MVVDILVEDSQDYDKAVDYIWRLEPGLAYPLLMKYARVLLEHCPKDATAIFIDYYTGQYRPKKDTVPPPEATANTGPSTVSNLASFIPLPYMQAAVSASPATAGNQQLSQTDVDAAQSAEPPADYETPKPRTAFSSFVDHPDEFVVFLEACLRQNDLETGDRTDLRTTLFELYLETANARGGLDRDQWETKAKQLLESNDVSGSSAV